MKLRTTALAARALRISLGRELGHMTEKPLLKGYTGYSKFEL